jgi:uncharacterized membrane protein
VQAIVQGAALLLTVLGLLSAGLVLARSRDVRQALAVLLEFLLAAGLLRLVHGATYQGLATTALIVVVRKLVSFGFNRGGHAGASGQDASPAGRRHRR